jgi:hypothetical protein
MQDQPLAADLLLWVAACTLILYKFLPIYTLKHMEGNFLWLAGSLVLANAIFYYRYLLQPA